MAGSKDKDGAFEAYEALPAEYHRDPRWGEVRELRERGDHLVANGLVMRIRSDYGFDY
jgi:hypothetical protein